MDRFSLSVFILIFTIIQHPKCCFSEIKIADVSTSLKNVKVFYSTTHHTDLLSAMHAFLAKHPDDIDKLIPDKLKIIFIVQLEEPLSPESVITQLSEAVAERTGLNVDTIQVSKYDAYAGIVKMFFLHAIKRAKGTQILHLRPIDPILKNLTTFQRAGNHIKVLTVMDGREYAYKQEHGKQLFDTSWQAWQWGMVIAFSLLGLGVFAIILNIFLGPIKAAVKLSHQPQQVVIQPVLRPTVAGVIQPLVQNSKDAHSESPSRSPIRRGLLERRGSNASLTLDLNYSQENIYCPTPPKECSAEEYLQSSSKKLNRHQLRSCLKDVKALYTEFWEIPMNHSEKMVVAGCGTKNRYKTILPNESTRVHLLDDSDDPLVSYINANYIRGHKGESHAYIATQGPLPHTVVDFWAMVWKEGSSLIVMITKLKEKLKVKCENYIPDFTGVYGDIEVTVIRVLPREGYTRRELHLRRGQEERVVHHLWYTSWPDHKTPATAKQMLGMALEAQSMRLGECKGPMVVHCSAGIGRTGCFIAVSIGIQQLVEENTVDILGTVCSLRLDRGGMIQTAEQYEFVHQALNMFERTLPE